MTVDSEGNDGIFDPNSDPEIRDSRINDNEQDGDHFRGRSDIYRCRMPFLMPKESDPF